ncbi:MAG: hypothetical protein WCQ53_06915, partial [bacterium]
NKDVPILQDMASQNIDLNGLIDLSSTPNVKMDVSFFNIILAIKKDYSAANLTILMDFPNEKKMYSLPYFAEGAISYNKTTKKISFLAVGERKVKNSSTYSKFNVEGIVGNDKTATFTIKNAAPGYTGKAFTDKTVFSIN